MWILKSCAATDSIENALNYKAVAKRLIEFVEQSEFFLVETLAERVSEIVLTEFVYPGCKSWKTGRSHRL